MTGAPILSGIPTVGLQKLGFDREEDRVSATRLQKSRQMQELADRAAAEGRELSIDEWFNMAQSAMEPGSVLSSSNPTGSILESMRTTSNERARQVAEDRKFRDMQNTHLLEDQVEKRVEQLSRSGKSEAEIQAELSSLYPEKIASRFTGRISSIAQRADVADQDMGMRLGGVLNNTKEAEDYIA
ncbi:MAG: hypothetical protein IIZ92_12730, partial [Aquincola sp.]|nr:hypothetical protein [Aquincola sp.]